MSPGRQKTLQIREFVQRFEEQLQWFLRHLDRPAALALLAGLGDGLARERFVLPNVRGPVLLL